MRGKVNLIGRLQLMTEVSRRRQSEYRSVANTSHSRGNRQNNENAKTRNKHTNIDWLKNTGPRVIMI
jgi:hypothetical protein